MPIVVAGQSPLYAGTYDCAKKTIQKEGFRGLYKGKYEFIYFFFIIEFV